MTPASLHEFFAASAGVAGALIGLLFVAISVEHERITAQDADQVHRVRAAAALSAFSNALVVSMFALIPGVGLRWPAFSVAISGLLFVIASLLSILRLRGVHRLHVREPLFLVGLVTVFVFQLVLALRLIRHDHNAGAAQGIAVLVVICFLIGIARAWELIGGPSIGIGSEFAALRGGRPDSARSGAPEGADREGDEDDQQAGQPGQRAQRG